MKTIEKLTPNSNWITVKALPQHLLHRIFCHICLPIFLNQAKTNYAASVVISDISLRGKHSI